MASLLFLPSVHSHIKDGMGLVTGDECALHKGIAISASASRTVKKYLCTIQRARNDTDTTPTGQKKKKKKKDM